MSARDEEEGHPPKLGNGGCVASAACGSEESRNRTSRHPRSRVHEYSARCRVCSAHQNVWPRPQLDSSFPSASQLRDSSFESRLSPSSREWLFAVPPRSAGDQSGGGGLYTASHSKSAARKRIPAHSRAQENGMLEVFLWSDETISCRPPLGNSTR